MATKRSKGEGKKPARAKKSAAVVAAPAEVATEPVVVAAQATPAEEPSVVEEPSVAEPPTDEIRRRAYNYWVQGNPDPVANWFRAVNDLKSH